VLFRSYAIGPTGRTELKVWPTNVVMRGVLVPPGVSQIEMHFEPFFFSRTALLCVIGGLVLGAAGWLVLRRVDRNRGPIPSVAATVSRKRAG